MIQACHNVFKNNQQRKSRKEPPIKWTRLSMRLLVVASHRPQRMPNSERRLLPGANCLAKIHSLRMLQYAQVFAAAPFARPAACWRVSVRMHQYLQLRATRCFVLLCPRRVLCKLPTASLLEGGCCIRCYWLRSYNSSQNLAYRV